MVVVDSRATDVDGGAVVTGRPVDAVVVGAVVGVVAPVVETGRVVPVCGRVVVGLSVVVVGRWSVDGGVSAVEVVVDAPSRTSPGPGPHAATAATNAIPRTTRLTVDVGVRVASVPGPPAQVRRFMSRHVRFPRCSDGRLASRAGRYPIAPVTGPTARLSAATSLSVDRRGGDVHRAQAVGSTRRTSSPTRTEPLRATWPYTPTHG